MEISSHNTDNPLAEKKPPRSASSAFDEPQERFIYELFSRMETSFFDQNRKHSVKVLREVGLKCTTSLKLASVENRLVDKRVYESDHILSTLQQCIIEKDNMDTSNLSADDAANVAEEEQIEQDSTPDAEQEDSEMLSRGNVELDTEEMDESDVESTQQRGFNVNCVKDVWHKGLTLLRSDNIKETRERNKQRNVRERKMMDVIGTCIENAMMERRNTRLEPEMEVDTNTDWLAQCKSMSRFG